MKKKFLLLVVAAFLLILPFSVNAGTKKVLGNDYTTMSFKEALEQEEISVPQGLTENDDQAIIYLFRGHGCGFCKAFLTFLSNIYGEYGKYFKVVTIEVWEDEANWYLMNQIAILKGGQPAEGVPYILIGDKVFSGYAESFDEDIKTAIKDLYNTKKSDRYDIFEVAEKEGLMSIEEMKEQFGSEEEGTANTSKSSNDDNKVLIIVTLVLVIVGTISIIIFNYIKFNELKTLIATQRIAEYVNEKPKKTTKKK